MSPTMTEGNIAGWKVKEGDPFSTGDILLEIETDKAQMDVEAQDDGRMQEAGSKGVKVGTRIAVLAETDDELSTLSIPAEESAPTPSPQEDLRSSIDASKSSKSQAKAPLSLKAEDSSPTKAPPPPSPSTSSGKSQKQYYPLYPSITQLLHENGLSSSEADKIPPSGPKGRLLKGDVLAYLGRISASYSSDQSARITKLGHLDLRNVKPAPSKVTAPSQPSKVQAQRAPAPELEPNDIEIALPISLSSVISVQKRIQATLGVTLPLSTFIARATELANESLPCSAASRPTADELFNDVLGLSNVSIKTSRGRYMPQIIAVPTKPSAERAGPRRQPDVYDMLTGRSSTTASTRNSGIPPLSTMACSKTEESTNVFSVGAAKGEEKRARVFLERVKTILQVEPGRLVVL
ncbi:MAG: pyridoxine biosynthesis protein [Alectoria sarmentosa]|nr:MAG: pyridoxine biosynthesis protein [Alectoria sarmentosa]